MRCFMTGCPVRVRLKNSCFCLPRAFCARGGRVVVCSCVRGPRQPCGTPRQAPRTATAPPPLRPPPWLAAPPVPAVPAATHAQSLWQRAPRVCAGTHTPCAHAAQQRPPSSAHPPPALPCAPPPAAPAALPRAAACATGAWQACGHAPRPRCHCCCGAGGRQRCWGQGLARRPGPCCRARAAHAPPPPARAAHPASALPVPGACAASCWQAARGPPVCLPCACAPQARPSASWPHPRVRGRAAGPRAAAPVAAAAASQHPASLHPLHRSSHALPSCPRCLLLQRPGGWCWLPVPGAAGQHRRRLLLALCLGRRRAAAAAAAAAAGSAQARPPARASQSVAREVFATPHASTHGAAHEARTCRRTHVVGDAQRAEPQGSLRLHAVDQALVLPQLVQLVQVGLRGAHAQARRSRVACTACPCALPCAQPPPPSHHPAPLHLLQGSPLVVLAQLGGREALQGQAGGRRPLAHGGGLWGSGATAS